MSYNGYCYQVVCPSNPLTHTEAAEECSKIGGRIGLPIDETINQLTHDRHKLYAWIDLTDEGHEGIWKDTGGNIPKYIGWGATYPNGGNCVYQGNSAQWDDTDCTGKKPCVLCQKGSYVSPVTAACSVAWTGHCALGGSKDIFRDTSKIYNTNECFQICESDPFCDSFSNGINGEQRCITFMDGCTPQPNQNANHYFIEDCYSGNKLSSKLRIL